jgi:pilus assembly protein CpaF
MTAVEGDRDLVDVVCRLASGLRGDVTDVVSGLVDQLDPLAGNDRRSRAIASAVARLAGLDALEIHLADDTVDEVMVNSGREVWIDRGGELEAAGELAPGAIDVVLERVLSPIGKRLDRVHPIVDVRLPDGSRLCAVSAPVAVDGTSLSIRRHRPRRFALTDFVDDGQRRDLPGDQLGELLDALISRRCNLLVSGATSSGKTSLLGALLEPAGSAERVVVCEDTTELATYGLHCIRLEARRATADGLPAVDMASLVRAALRLRPDRLVVGEFRGAEVLAAVEAMNTGHDGSMATCHANSAVDALRRVETLLMQAAPSWPLFAIRRQVTRSIDAVIHVARQPHGRRRIVEVAEVVESGDEPEVKPLFGGERTGQLRRGRRPA